MALAMTEPSKVSKKNKGVLAMPKEVLGDFAATSTKGLPSKVKDGSNLLAKIAGGKGSAEVTKMVKRRIKR
jgi:phage gp45-like